MPETEKNLRAALQGESEAKKKYELFGKKAQEEGHPFLSRVFFAISHAESIHIKNHLKALSVLTGKESQLDEFVSINEDEIMKKVKTTKENLQDAIKGEIYETKIMYKEFINNSRVENRNVAELSFELAKKAEYIHAKIFKKYLKILEKNKSILEEDLYVCQICGNVEFQKPPKKCPICDHDQFFFKKM